MEMKLSRNSNSDGAEFVARGVQVLPSEVIEDILSWVPTKPLARFRCVCKHFRSLLKSDPYFAHKHFIHTIQIPNPNETQNQNIDGTHQSLLIQIMDSNNFYYIPNGDFDRASKLETSYMGEYPYIAGSSNGLICLHHALPLGGPNVMDITLWNPATQQYKLLPVPNIKRFTMLIVLGFGFQPTLIDYKVVRIVPFGKNCNHVDERGTSRAEVEVYSLSTNSWKTLAQQFPYDVPYMFYGADVNGCLHWLGNHGDSQKKYEFILSFDMTEEVFRVLPMPIPPTSPTYFNNIVLQLFGGCLSMFVLNQGKDIHVWVMKEYGVEASWTKLITVEYEEPTIFNRLVCFLNDDEILLQKAPFKLVSYNSKTRRLDNVSIKNLPELEIRPQVDVVSYAESLVQLPTHNQADDGQQPN